METMIAYCGLDCSGCPIHLATLEQDKSHQRVMRESIAGQCTKYYGMSMTAEDINDCDGCRAADDRIFSRCLQCVIRKCAISKYMTSCAFCEEYACEKLLKNFVLDPDARTRLEEIRKDN